MGEEMKKVVFLCLLLIVGLELNVLKNNAAVSSSENVKTDEFSLYMNLVDDIFSELQCFPVVKE